MQNNVLPTQDPPRLLLHTIRLGDTMYNLAREYGTTVAQIQQLNPQTDPLNLQFGAGLLIMPGQNYVPPLPPFDQNPLQDNPLPQPLPPDLGAHQQGEHIADFAFSNPNYTTPMPTQPAPQHPPQSFVEDSLPPLPNTPTQSTPPIPAPLQSAQNTQPLPSPLRLQDNFRQVSVGGLVPQSPPPLTLFEDTPPIQENSPLPPVQAQSHNTAPAEGTAPTPHRASGTMSRMRFVWTQHCYWTRMLLISITEKLKDQEAVSRRLMENPVDIGALYVQTSGSDTARTINNLLSQHLRTGGELITAMRDRRGDIDGLRRYFYANAEKLADAFVLASALYDRETLRKFFLKNLDLTIQQINMRLSGNFKAEILAFAEIEKQSLALADYLSSGL
ncbi:MAG: LysM peptidoglycan-binding domain-containing protein [Firmicutes bacterium]|nr:LysM peptidoglycan-binding domain-containing protein [Bacillota bacterium]